MKKFYKIAGIGIEIDIPDDKIYTDERSLGAFACENSGGEEYHRFSFSFCYELTAPKGEEVTIQPGFRVYREGEWNVRYIGSVQDSWEAAYIRAAHRGYEHLIELKAGQFKERVGVHTVLNCLMMEHLIAENCGFIFHSSYIDIGGAAVLFTAPSGTGKSTQAELWRANRGAEIINGDRSAVKYDGDIMVCGIPFAGSSEYCKNVTLPLNAIVYLRQAPVTTIRKLRGAEAFRRVWEGVSVNIWDKADTAAVTDVVLKAVSSVPIYELSCTPDITAVEALEMELKKIN